MVRRLVVAIALTIFVVAPSAARTGNYPSRVVKIIVPNAAGGPLDALARAVAETLSERLKQSFIVENRPGGGGNIGIQAGIAAPPDGYTLMVVAGSMLTTNPSLYKKAPFDPRTDLRPISTLTVSSQTLVVHPSLPVRSLEDFIAYAKKNAVGYATSGYGTPSHLTMEYLRMLAGFPATAITYRGLSPLMVDLLAGQVKVGFVATAGIVAHVEQGKLRPLAVSTATRSKLPLMKDVPAVAEFGYPEFDVPSYNILVAPAGIPASIAALLEQEAQHAVTLPAFQQRFQASEIFGVGSDGAQTQAWIAKELARWAKLIKAAKMQVN
jgi:tripartite-type tricarboxylate transporter receptor subunit TctC